MTPLALSDLARVLGCDCGAADIEIIMGAAAPVFCVAEAGADSNGDGIGDLLGPARRPPPPWRAST